MHSGLYEGRVRHRRMTPVNHEFTYRLWLAWLDLDEIEEVFRGRLLWSTSRLALLRYKRKDHLGDPGIPLDEAVRDLVFQKLGRRPDGPVRLLTQLRYAGFLMNPVCFYYCYKMDGVTIDAIVAEVNNTPWNEQHCYVLDPNAPISGDLSEKMGAHLTGVKEFHVSPFMGMDQEYHWTLHQPGESLSLKLANHEHGQQIFDADLNLTRRELTTFRMAWMAVRYPFQSMRVFASIYWQALKLWWKKCPPYPHPDHRQLDPLKPNSQSENLPRSPSSMAGAETDSPATSETPTVAS
jgi:DUF1365 family protein